MMKKRGRNMGLLTLMGVFLLVGFLSQGCTDSKETNVAGGGGGVTLSGSLRGSVFGTVQNVKGELLPGMRVYMAGQQTTTNAGGQYRFTNVPVSGEARTVYCDDDCYIELIPGSPYLITVVDQDGVYVDTITAARLDYTTLQKLGQISLSDADDDAVIGGDNSPITAVGDLAVEAVVAIMGTPTARVRGRVYHGETLQPVGGVLVALSGAPVPSAEDIWNDGFHDTRDFGIGWGEGACTWAFPDNVAPATDSLTGEFLLTTVPERTDASPWDYTVTYSLAGFVATPTLGDVTVSVGFGGGLEYQVDVDSGDADPMTPMLLLPKGLVPDDQCPYVVSSNIPVNGEIGFNERDTTFTVRFNEPMDCNAGIATLDAIGFKAPGPLAVVATWADEPSIPELPQVCQTLQLDPVEILPEGMRIQLTLGSDSTTRFRDLAGNAYNGEIRCDEGADALGSTDTMVSFVTGGSALLLQATNFRQTPAVIDTDQPVGGKSGNISAPNQANNLNILDQNNVLGLGTLGDADDETDNLCFDWTAASGSPRQYILYAEYLTGGIIGGLPVVVGETMKSALPPTSACVRLRDVCQAMADASLPNFCDANGSTRFLDNGMGRMTPGLNFAVTTVNSNAEQGPFSNSVAAGDITPPTMADQGDGFDTSLVTPVNGTAPTGLAVQDLTSGYGGVVDVDLEVLDEIGGIPGDNLYNADNWTAFGATANSIDLQLSEDLNGGQDMSSIGTLTTSGGATLDSTAIPGTGSNRRIVTAALTGLSLLSPGDTLSLAGILDEAGNLGEADCTAIFGDSVSPLFTTGTTSDNGTSEDQLIMTATEPLDQATAEDETNWDTSGTINLAGATATLDPSNTVTIEVPDGQLGDVTGGYVCDPAVPATDIPPNNWIAMPGVEDLNGNTGVPAKPAVGSLSFQVADGIGARITAAYHPGPIDINDDAPACVDANDNQWCILDTDASNELYVIIVEFSESVVTDADCSGVIEIEEVQDTGIAGTVDSDTTPGSVYALTVAVGPVSPATDTVRFEITRIGGQSAGPGDYLRVTTADDLAGNSLNSAYSTITLLDVAGAPDGIDIGSPP